MATVPQHFEAARQTLLPAAHADSNGGDASSWPLHDYFLALQECDLISMVAAARHATAIADGPMSESDGLKLSTFLERALGRNSSRPPVDLSPYRDLVWLSGSESSPDFAPRAVLLAAAFP